MRITKSAANSVAIKLTEKKTIQLKKIKSEISDIGYAVLKGQIPKKILDLYGTNSGYFKTISSVHVTGKGLNNQPINFSKNLPSTDTYRKTILVDDKNALELSTRFNQIEKLGNEIEKLQLEIEAALLSLCTYAKITSEFKEAIPFLPFKEKNELVVNIKEIIAKL